MSDVTLILQAIENGDGQASERLLPIVYDELRKLAAHKLSQERPGQTLGATALVHEAYLRLVTDAPSRDWVTAGTFLPPRPKPCDAFSSKTPAARRA